MSRLVAAAAANDAASAGAMVSLLSLGIPGSGATAVLLGAFMMWGLQPGLLLIVGDRGFAWELIASMFLANIFLIAPSIIETWIFFASGLIGFAMKKSGYSPAATVLALVLRSMAEETFLQTYIISESTISLYWERPVSLVLSLVLLSIIVIPLMIAAKRRFAPRRATMGGDATSAVMRSALQSVALRMLVVLRGKSGGRGSLRGKSEDDGKGKNLSARARRSLARSIAR